MTLENTYRPKTYADIVGQDQIIASIKPKGQNLQDMLFVGNAGTGKTTLAHVIALENGLEIIEKNASDERGIGVVRGDIKNISRFSGKRILLLDESDELTSDAQGALRRTMEQSEGTIFILTANDEHKFIEPILSRCAVYRFNQIKDIEI